MDLRKYKPQLIIDHAGETIKRFPLVVFICLMTGIFCEVYALQKGDSHVPLQKYLLTLFLLIPTSVSFVFLRERGQKKLGWPLFLIPLAFLLLYPREQIATTAYRFSQLLVATHLFAAFAPFLRGNRAGSFWEFNKSLFLRFLLSSIYSGVLLAGLFTCMGAMNLLFLASFPGNAFFVVFLFCAFVFQPLHFLAGVPRDFDRESSYPRALLIFCKNLLVPLIVLLGLILVVYGITIAAQMEWPQGKVSLFTTTFAVVGIFSLLLIDPLVRAEDGWFRKYARIFYPVLALLSLLMLAAVWRRVSEYGVTEERFYIVLESLWLIFVGSLFSLRPKRSIVLIPVSLFVITLATAYGPWSPSALSLSSQKARLLNLLREYEFLVDGKLAPTEKPLPSRVRDNLSSTVSYLSHHFGEDSLKELIPGASLTIGKFYKILELTRPPNSRGHWNFRANSFDPEEKISGFDRMTRISANVGSGNYTVVLGAKALTLRPFPDAEVNIPVEEIMEEAKVERDRYANGKLLRFEGVAGKKRWRLLLEEASGFMSEDPEDSEFSYVSGILLH